VVGLPDERWGERVVAVVAARPEASVTLDDVQSFCRDKIGELQSPPPAVPGR